MSADIFTAFSKASFASSHEFIRTGQIDNTLWLVHVEQYILHGVNWTRNGNMYLCERIGSTLNLSLFVTDLPQPFNNIMPNSHE